MPLILISNDDGVHAPGIIALMRAMKELGDIIVIAPDRERSASGHSLTLHRPLKVEELRENVFSVSGTPTDCVALAISKLLPKKPDLMVSGINKGSNLGDDITYSGTVSAAVEATILGVPSIAFSIVMDGNHPLHFDSVGHYAIKTARHVLEHSLPYDTLLNVNVPNLPIKDIKGVKITRQCKRLYDGAVKEIISPWGEKHYWIGGGKPYWEHGDDTDSSAVFDGYVSLTPIHLDLTNYDAIKYFKEKKITFDD